MAKEIQLINRAELIKDRITMFDVLTMYGYEPKRRIKCPLHHGDDKNFAVSEHGYICFSHCGTGDVITFVQKLFGLSFADTLKKIDSDFRLGLYESPKDFEELRRLKYQAERAKAKREAAEQRKKFFDDEYWKAFKEWQRLDNNRREYAPKSEDEPLNPLFVEALTKIGYQEYLVDYLNEKRDEQ